MLQPIVTELGDPVAVVVSGVVAATAIYLFVIVATRVAGLRSFSKMSAFDFAMTVAIGSLVASAASGQAALATVAAGVTTLYLLQAVVAQLRRSRALHGVVDNTPLLLMDGPRILDDNLDAARVTRDDLHAKLREANALTYDRIRAVVLETTGDISVLHGEGPVEPELLRGVRRSVR